MTAPQQLFDFSLSCVSPVNQNVLKKIPQLKLDNLNAFVWLSCPFPASKPLLWFVPNQVKNVHLFLEYELRGLQNFHLQGFEQAREFTLVKNFISLTCNKLNFTLKYAEAS